MVVVPSMTTANPSSSRTTLDWQVQSPKTIEDPPKASRSTVSRGFGPHSAPSPPRPPQNEHSCGRGAASPALPSLAAEQTWPCQLCGLRSERLRGSPPLRAAGQNSGDEPALLLAGPPPLACRRPRPALRAAGQNSGDEPALLLAGPPSLVSRQRVARLRAVSERTGDGPARSFAAAASPPRAAEHSSVLSRNDL